MTEIKAAPSGPGGKSILKLAISRFIMALLIMGVMFFLPAGTFNYWEAWIYLLVISVPLVFTVRYLYKRDPELLKRRMRTRETQKTQKWVIALSLFFFVPAFILPGFDKRFGWSNVPSAVVIIADVMVLLGYLIVSFVFRANTYASRVVEVEKGQKVISTGPYAVVRHPMYSGVTIYYTFSPLALGSHWAVLPALLMIPLLVFRIKGEEQELAANLPGYKEYMAKTKYRLVPGIW